MFYPSATAWGRPFLWKTEPARHMARGQVKGLEGDRNAELRRAEPPSGWRNPLLEHGIPELAVMANVLNPETESITLNTELETPTLDPATELELCEN